MATHSNAEGDATGPGPADRPGSPDPSPAYCRVPILNPMGFHLRPIQQFIAVAQEYQAEIQVRYEGRSCNGRSFLDLISLAAEYGNDIELLAWGADARQLLDALAALFAARFFEDEFGQPLKEPDR
ncbi:MAG: HPr family phosphocarrier protein [Isosphaeraceae bacterium]